MVKQSIRDSLGMVPVDEVRLSFVDQERSFESEGELAFHPAVRAVYLLKGFDSAPKDKDEAKEQGVKGFNGMNISAPHIHMYRGGSGTVAVANVFPTRYLHRQALDDVITTLGKDSFTDEELVGMNTQMLHVSLLVAAKMGDQYGIMGHVKGKDVLGAGALHGAAAAGGLLPKHFAQRQAYAGASPIESVPMTWALKKRVFVEMGIDTADIDRTTFAYRVNEPHSGHTNFASVRVGVQEMDDLAQSFRGYLSGLAEGETPEVKGLAFMPLKDNGGLQVDNVYVSAIGDDGKFVQKWIEPAALRPYTEAMVDHFASGANVTGFFDKAGR